MADYDKEIDQLTFKEAMDELEKEVSLLESGTLELEQSLKSYARGVALLSNLQTRLDSAQQEVEVLMGQLDSTVDDDIQDTTLSKA